MAYSGYPQDSQITSGTISAADVATVTTAGSNASSIYTGAPTTNSFVSMSALNYNSYVIQLTGTWVGTVQVESSFDNGVTWYRITPQVRGVSNTALTITANGAFIGEAAVATNIRVRAIAWTSGTATVAFSQSPSSEIVRIDNPIRLYDNVSAQQATIKAASTTPLATDTSIVTAENPNSPLFTNTIKTKLANDIAQTTGTITTSTSTITTGALSGVGSATVQFSGTFAGVNATFEGSVDNTNWIAIPALPLATATPTVTTTTGVIATTSLYNLSPLLGINYIRVRATAFTSGTANVIIQPSAQFYGYNVNAIVTSAPTTAITGTVTASTTTGAAADNAAVSGNPVRIAGQAYTTNPTAHTTTNTANFITDKLGKQVTVQSIRDLKARQSTTLTSTTTETTIITAGAAGVFNDLYGLIIANTSATATQVTVRDVTAGGTPLYFNVPAGDTRGFMLSESAAMKQTTAASAWTAQCGTSVASVFITALSVANL